MQQITSFDFQPPVPFCQVVKRISQKGLSLNTRQGKRTRTSPGCRLRKQKLLAGSIRWREREIRKSMREIKPPTRRSSNWKRELYKYTSQQTLRIYNKILPEAIETQFLIEATTTYNFTTDYHFSLNRVSYRAGLSHYEKYINVIIEGREKGLKACFPLRSVVLCGGTRSRLFLEERRRALGAHLLTRQPTTNAFAHKIVGDSDRCFVIFSSIIIKE